MLLFHGNNCYVNALQCYVIRTSPVLLLIFKTYAKGIFNFTCAKAVSIGMFKRGVGVLCSRARVRVGVCVK
jgi:hypothetical protein